MANLIAKFYGSGEWTQPYAPPTATAFTQDLRSAGWHPSNFNLVITADNRYYFEFTINDSPTKNTPNLDMARLHLLQYFEHYFNNVSLNVDSTSIVNTPVSTGGNSQNNGTVLSAADITAMIAANNKSSVPLKNGSSGTFQKIADDLKIPVFALGFIGIAALLVIGQRK